MNGYIGYGASISVDIYIYGKKYLSIDIFFFEIYPDSHSHLLMHRTILVYPVNQTTILYLSSNSH